MVVPVMRFAGGKEPEFSFIWDLGTVPVSRRIVFINEHSVWLIDKFYILLFASIINNDGNF
jgi:hypothetical protein